MFASSTSKYFLQSGSDSSSSFSMASHWAYWGSSGKFRWLEKAGLHPTFAFCAVSLPRIRLRLTVLLASIVVALGARLMTQLAAGPENDWMTPAWFQEVVSRVRFSEHRLLPSWWLEHGPAADGQCGRGEGQLDRRR